MTRVNTADVTGIKAFLRRAAGMKRAGELAAVEADERIEVYRRDRQMGQLARLLIDTTWSIEARRVA